MIWGKSFSRYRFFNLCMDIYQHYMRIYMVEEKILTKFQPIKKTKNSWRKLFTLIILLIYHLFVVFLIFCFKLWKCKFKFKIKKYFQRQRFLVFQHWLKYFLNQNEIWRARHAEEKFQALWKLLCYADQKRFHLN